MRILVTAETFGYGPIVTVNYVVEKLKHYLNAQFVFLGSGIDLEQAKSSALYDDYIFCKTYEMSELEKHKDLFVRSDFLISSENQQGAIFAIKNHLRTFYIDNLFWMWKSIPEELYNVQIYFATEIFDIETNLSKFGVHIKRIERIKPLRILKDTKYNDINVNDQILINLGGGESFLSDFNLVKQYYTVLIDQISIQAQKKGIKQMTVCGGSRLCKSLKAEFKHAHNMMVKFSSLTPQQCLQQLHQSKYIFLSPGLGNFLECLSIGRRVFMFPSINYSQFLQMEEYRKLSLGIDILNWNDFDHYCEVERYVEEEDGVGQVLKNINQCLQNLQSITQISDAIGAYFDYPSVDYKEVRKQYRSRFGGDGIKQVTEIILREIKDVSF